EHRESDTILLTNGVRLGMSGRALANLYYLRWPIQENAFKQGEAVRLADHRGNCGTIVSNVVVVKKCGRLEKQANAMEETLRRLDKEKEILAQAHRQSEEATRMLGARREELAKLAANKETSWEALGQGLRDHQQAQRHEEACAQALSKVEVKEAATEARRAKVTEELKRLTEEREKLEPQTTIRQLDVALDSVLTAVKLA